MDLRTMVVKLLDVLPCDERRTFQMVLDVNGENSLEGRLYPDIELQIQGRFEWFFDRNGDLRSHHQKKVA